MIELGIYGGTFAPIHNGHVHAARAFYDELSLDRLLVIPAFLPPHKTVLPGDDPAARLEMARLAFRGDERKIEISDYEIRKGGKSYTYKTLAHFSDTGVRLTFLCGTDMFLTLENWRYPQVIFALSRIAHVRRFETDLATERLIAEAADRYQRRYGAEICQIAAPPLSVSSTEIRSRCRCGKDISDLVPEAVREYIDEFRLYGGPSEEGAGHDGTDTE